MKGCNQREIRIILNQKDTPDDMLFFVCFRSVHHTHLNRPNSLFAFFSFLKRFFIRFSGYHNSKLKTLNSQLQKTKEVIIYDYS